MSHFSTPYFSHTLQKWTCYHLKIHIVFMRWDKYSQTHSWNSFQTIGVIFGSNVANFLVQIQELSIIRNWKAKKDPLGCLSLVISPRSSYCVLHCNNYFLFPFWPTLSLLFKYSKYCLSLLVFYGIQPPLSPTLAFFFSLLHQGEYLSWLNVSFIAESSLYYWQNVNFFLISTHARLHWPQVCNQHT